MTTGSLTDLKFPAPPEYVEKFTLLTVDTDLAVSTRYLAGANSLTFTLPGSVVSGSWIQVALNAVTGTVLLPPSGGSISGQSSIEIDLKHVTVTLFGSGNTWLVM